MNLQNARFLECGAPSVHPASSTYRSCAAFGDVATYCFDPRIRVTQGRSATAAKYLTHRCMRKSWRWFVEHSERGLTHRSQAVAANALLFSLRQPWRHLTASLRCSFLPRFRPWQLAFELAVLLMPRRSKLSRNARASHSLRAQRCETSMRRRDATTAWRRAVLC